MTVRMCAWGAWAWTWACAGIWGGKGGVERSSLALSLHNRKPRTTRGGSQSRKEERRRGGGRGRRVGSARSNKADKAGLGLRFLYSYVLWIMQDLGGGGGWRGRCARPGLLYTNDCNGTGLRYPITTHGRRARKESLALEGSQV